MDARSRQDTHAILGDYVELAPDYDVDREEARRLCAAAIYELHGPSASGGAGGLGLVSVGKLLAEPEESVPWLVGGMLPTGGLSVLAAKPKVGKSTLARQLAVACAKGGVFLGRDVLRGPVVYLALEEKRAEVRRHFREMGVTQEDPIYCYFGVAPADTLAKLRKDVDNLRPVLIIVDPLFRMARVKDGNDYAQVTGALEPFLALARETGTHLLAVHHSGKAERAGADSILGSTAISGGVDTVLLLKRGERYRTIVSVQRYGSDLEETVLAFDAASRTVSLAASREEEELARIGSEMLQVLSTRAEPMKEEAILAEVESRLGLKRRALRALLDSSKVERLGEGKRNDPFRYRVADSSILVPDIYRERENAKEKSAEGPLQRWPKARSLKRVTSGDDGNENPEGGNENSPSRCGYHVGELSAPCGQCGRSYSEHLEAAGGSQEVLL